LKDFQRRLLEDAQIARATLHALVRGPLERFATAVAGAGERGRKPNGHHAVANHHFRS
jgi:hypothetical protein